MASGQLVIGHQKFLLGHLVFGILNFVLAFLHVFPELFFLQPIIWITSIIAVHLDPEVNRTNGKGAAGCGRLLFLFLLDNLFARLSLSQ
jgi:hypothetical protein